MSADGEHKGAAGADSMSFMEHFKELRSRLIKIFLSVLLGFILCWFIRSQIVDFLFAPLLAAMRGLELPEVVIATGVPETFLTYMQIALMSGIFVSSPLIFYQVWAFIAPGLYEKEKTHIVPIALASALFFILGGAFCYFIVFANAMPFLMGFGEEYIHNTPRLSEYYDFALHLLLAFGLIFELPLFVFFLSRLGLVTAPMLKRFRRYFIVIAFIVSAVLTPPDIPSQLCMVAPMLILYEFSIFIAKFCASEKEKKEIE
jgi:sec-independent protein translocase protein TatC